MWPMGAEDIERKELVPYGDEEFDAVTIAVSVDYLARCVLLKRNR